MVCLHGQGERRDILRARGSGSSFRNFVGGPLWTALNQIMVKELRFKKLD